MSTWYGKECKHQCNQWEETETTGGPNYKEATPALTFCNHPQNPDDHEGNCRENLCPIKHGNKAIHLIQIDKVSETYAPPLDGSDIWPRPSQMVEEF